MNEYYNYFGVSLKKDDALMNSMQNAIEKLYSSKEDYFYSTKNIKAKFFADPKAKMQYLIVEKNGVITIYDETIYSYTKKDPFSYLIPQLKNPEIHASWFLNFKGQFDKTLPIKVDPLKLQLALMFKDEKDTDEQATEKFMTSKEVNFQTSSIYKVRSFFNFLYEEKCLAKKITEKYLINHSNLINKEVNDEVSDMFLSIDFFKTVSKKRKFTAKKKYVFNDSDNGVWAQEQGVCVESQGAGFYIIKNGNNCVVYGCDKEGEEHKKHSSMNALIKDVSENPDNLIDNVVLKVENNKVVFTDNCFISSLSSSIHYAKDALFVDFKELPDYPVDIKSYDYQLAWYQKNYNTPEFNFLEQAFLTLGGFDYDKIKGVMSSSDVTFDASLIDAKKKVFKGKHSTFSYCIPNKGIVNLDDKWLAGLEYLTQVLKNDKPVPTVSLTKNKEKDVADTVVYFEKLIKNLKAKNKKNSLSL